MSETLCCDAYDGALLLVLLSFGPGGGQDFGDLVVGHVGRPTQHVAKMSQRVQPASRKKVQPPDPHYQALTKVAPLGDPPLAGPFSIHVNVIDFRNSLSHKNFRQTDLPLDKVH